MVAVSTTKLLRYGSSGVIAGAAAVVGLGVSAERLVMRRERSRPEISGAPVMPVGTTESMVETDDGGSIRVLQAGEGPVVLLVHGITLAAEVWGYQMADLAAAGFRAVAVDLRGHGKTVSGRDGLSLHRLGADLGCVLEALDVTEVTAVGHSMGGMALMELLSDSTRVTGLVLVATSSSPVLGLGSAALAGIVKAVNPFAVRASVLSRHMHNGVLRSGDLAYLLTRAAFGSRPSPTSIELTEAMVVATPASTVVELGVALSVFDRRAALSEIDVPTAVVVGSRDLLTAPRQARDMAGRIAGSELVVLDGCGHMVMLERRRQLHRIIVGLAESARMGGALTVSAAQGDR